MDDTGKIETHSPGESSGKIHEVNISSILDYLFIHVFLPPKLPRGDDRDRSNDKDFVRLILDALESFKKYSAGKAVEECIRMLSSFLHLRATSTSYNAETLGKAINNMGEKDTLVLHIDGQNAGMMIRRRSDQFIFESFELSPIMEAVMTTNGRLQRSFPGPAIAIPDSRVRHKNFIQPITEAIAQLDAETPPQVLRTVHKERSHIFDIKESPHPGLVTQMLTGVFRAIGEPYEVQRLQKNIRDDVVWKDTKAPWRRSSLWLCLRVALQTTLFNFREENPEQSPHEQYKSFMIFFMASILEKAVAVSWWTHGINLMQLKIVQRIMKLQPLAGQGWMEPVKHILDNAANHCNTRWGKLQGNADPFGLIARWNGKYSILSPSEDTILHLNSLSKYLEMIRTRGLYEGNDCNFLRRNVEKIDLGSSKLPKISNMLESTDDVKRVLIDFENWVELHLDRWLANNITDKKKFGEMKKQFDEYLQAARPLYVDSPEDTSILILTTFEVWVALDRFVIHHHELLSEYDPVLPSDQFAPLLLPKLSQTERLRKVEGYLQSRSSKATACYPSVMTSWNEPESFSVRFFEKSSSLKALKVKVDKQTEEIRSKKIEELKTSKAEYSKMMASQALLKCTTVATTQQDGTIVLKHEHGCKKCEMRERAENLNISVYERPLPADELSAKGLIFEIDPPILFCHWRDITHTIAADVLSNTLINPSSSYKSLHSLWSIEDLKRFQKFDARRIELRSSTKPFILTHYRTQNVSVAMETSVCVDSGLKYSLYDAKKHWWTSEKTVYNVLDQCTFQIPVGPYKPLQEFANTTKHSPNEVVSFSAASSGVLTEHEVYAYLILRSGHRLQWLNIARELASSNLNFNCEEVDILVRHAIWQIGSGTEDRFSESHYDAKEKDFGLDLISALESQIEKIKGNWQNVIALRVFSQICSRVLSVSAHVQVQDNCISLMRQMRNISFDWLRRLSEKTWQVYGSDLQKLNELTLEVALTCYNTFDVDFVHLERLFKGDDDVSIFTETSVTIKEKYIASVDMYSKPIKILLDRKRRLSHRLEMFFRQGNVPIDRGLDETIKRFWSDYRPKTSKWSTVKDTNEFWKSIESEGHSSRCIQVLYNFMEGELLIDGSSPSRLPSSYESHPSYRRIFGLSTLEVMKSTNKDMAFQTREKFKGYQIYFRLEEPDLIIQLRDHERTLEYLPPRAFEGDFPCHFIHHFIHLLDLRSYCVDWIDPSDLWKEKPARYSMFSTPLGKTLHHGCKTLVDINSATSMEIASLLSPLANVNDIHLLLNPESEVIDVSLPKLELDFCLEKGSSRLISKQFRDMHVDENQSVGVLTGLENKLVLKMKDSESRIILIPEGNITIEATEIHVTIKINSTEEHIPYHAYPIDTSLGRLKPGESIQSQLYLCYLHALTASNSPDSLTGRTGTEEALSILQSAGVMSTTNLDNRAMKLLHAIARCSPTCNYYPKHLKIMQNIEWNGMPQLSQHSRFARLAKELFDQKRTINSFQNEAPSCSLEIPSEISLVRRSEVRNSTFYVDGFGAESHSMKVDNILSPRDMDEPERELRVYQISKLVDDWTPKLNICPNLLETFLSWNAVINFRDSEFFNLGYDSRFLDQPKRVFPSNWGSLFAMLTRTTPDNDKISVMLLLSTLSYMNTTDEKLVQTLLAFAVFPKIRLIDPPGRQLFDVTKGFDVNKDCLAEIVRSYALRLEDTPEFFLPQNLGEPKRAYNKRRKNSYKEKVDDYCDKLSRIIYRKRASAPTEEGFGSNFSTHISMGNLIEAIDKLFKTLHSNSLLRNYFIDVQKVLGLIEGVQCSGTKYTYSPQGLSYLIGPRHVSLDELFQMPALVANYIPPPGLQHLFDYKRLSTDHGQLTRLLDRLKHHSGDKHQKRYADNLRKSLDSLPQDRQAVIASKERCEHELRYREFMCKTHNELMLNSVRQALQFRMGLAHKIAFEIGAWPRITPITLLQRITANSRKRVNAAWQQALINYALSIFELQKVRRLLKCLDKESELLIELENPGHTNWNPSENPDWLLLEIENNITIRENQVQICREMTTPSSGKNSIYQMDMGEGKSSVIVPMAITELANGNRLARVIVLRSLSKQMFHQLVSKLGRILNRRVFCLPISRSVVWDTIKVNQMRNTLEECMNGRGVLLAQPEQLLSFELIGPERILLGAENDLGQALIHLRTWIHDNSRDILDECDEVLGYRSELIYTMGSQKNIDYSPDRWLLIEEVLSLAATNAIAIGEMFPNEISIIKGGSDAIPRIQVLCEKASLKLRHYVAQEIVEKGLPQLPIWTFGPEQRKLLFCYICDPELSRDDISRAEKLATDTQFCKQPILLLKGLLAGGALEFVLRHKRWRVDYGLDSSRSMLAVPYTAKDVPALRSEFSHPEISIITTCLSYYYGGLSDPQMRKAFETLSSYDQSKAEYKNWIRNVTDLQPEYHSLDGVNFNDSEICSNYIFPKLRFSKPVIDFYLNSTVFAKEMKEFPQRLSSSAWDIGKKKKCPTTGFSGTNDNRYILPLSVHQQDTPEQLKTNAAVLECLLRPENTYYQGNEIVGDGTYAQKLLEIVLSAEPPIRVILDVGAQVLEWNNQEMARAWLHKCQESEVQAVVYFDDDDELSVLTRDNRIEPFHVSASSKQLHRCLIYLDEVHTRGTDLKLPDNYRAAVTLGPRLEKDRIAQAAKRLRKLGKGQSVMFYAPPEIERDILVSNKKSVPGVINVEDVLLWSMLQSCSNAKKSVALWAIQGLRHLLRSGREQNVSPGTIKELLETEARTIEECYGSKTRSEYQILVQEIRETTPQNTPQLEAILEKVQEFDLPSLDECSFHAEQERELAPENEHVREREHAKPLQPYLHRIHSDVREFVKKGKIKAKSPVFVKAFNMLKSTSIRSLDPGTWPSGLWVTSDFAKTVHAMEEGYLDFYLRPVHWVIRSRRQGSKEYVIVSPFEANEFLPEIRQSLVVSLHVYSPKVNIDSLQLSGLSFCSVPPLAPVRDTITIMLNLFAAVAYFEDYEEYLSTCQLLGLCFRPPGDDIEIAPDGFVLPSTRFNYDSRMAVVCPFKISPVPFLKSLISLRRGFHNVDSSHVGRLLRAQPINDFTE